MNDQELQQAALNALLDVRLRAVPAGQKQPFRLETLLALAVEGKIIEMMTTEGWSSRVRADDIVKLVLDGIKGDRLELDCKPWEAFAVGKQA